MKFHSLLVRLLVAVMLPAIITIDSFASDEGDSVPLVLKAVVYGATGRVGSRVTNEALNRGHLVTAVSRDPGRVKQQHNNLIVVQGDVLDRESVKQLVNGHDVVIVSVRGSVDGSKDPDRTVHRMAAELIVDVLRDMGDSAPRLIVVGGAGSLEVKPGVLYADSIPRVMRILMPRSLRQEIGGHVSTLNYLSTVDDVRWTYISPAKKFEPGERTGTYRVGGDQMLKDGEGKSIISMEDFSMALIDEVENPKHVGARFSVAY